MLIVKSHLFCNACKCCQTDKQFLEAYSTEKYNTFIENAMVYLTHYTISTKNKKSFNFIVLCIEDLNRNSQSMILEVAICISYISKKFMKKLLKIKNIKQERRRREYTL